MAINKKFIHFKTFSNFNSKKLSANEGNTAYTEGLNGEIKTGAPEILYQSICYIQDVQKQWTHGQLYDFERVQPDNEIWYTTSDESVVFGNFTYNREDWYISNTYANGIGIMRFKHPITHINDGAFDSDTLTSIIMPKSLESIGNRSFYGCGKLETVYLPKSCQSIGSYAFYHCINLKNIDISNIYELGEHAFEYTKIETINFKCYDVAYGAFSGCQNLKTIILPEGLDTIEGIAFYGSYYTSSLVIPASVTTIGVRAFQITGLKEIYLKSSTPPTIPTPPQSGEYAEAPFDLNESDLKIYVPYESLDTYKNAVGWKKYKDKIIAQVNSGNLKTINGTSLVGSGNIEISTGGSIDLSNYYTKEEIENKGYIVDTQLENYATKSELNKKQNILTSGTNIKTINDKTILGKGNLTITENIQSDWLGITVQDGAIKNRTHYVTGTKITSPGTYTVSGSQIYFDGKIYNLEVGVKTTLKTMPYVYATLTSNSTLVIDDSGKYTSSYPIVVVTSIKTLDDAFISDNIVRNSELEDYVTKETFESDLNNKQEILESGYNIKTINGEDILNTGNIYIVQNNNEIWYTTTDGDECDINFDNFIESFEYSEIPKDTWIMVFDSDVTSIGAEAFAECENLQSISIPNKVTEIEELAFHYCSSLTSVTMGNSVTSIGNDAFSFCSSLTSITLPEGVTSIREQAFMGCTSLTSITIPDSVTLIESSTFEGCSSLTSITIPESVISIGNGAFSDCSSLISVTIGNGVTTIGNYAFHNCSSLKSITIPNSVTEIGDDAFLDCNALTTVTINSNNCQFGIDVFNSSPNIKVINCNSNNPPIVNGDLNLPENVKIYVPIESLNAYKTVDGWNNYADNICAIIDSSNIKTINGESILGEGDIVFNQVDWNESDETSSAYVKNRTHYAPFNRIEIPKTISSTTWTYISIPNSAGCTLYIKYTFSGQVKSAALTMSDLNVEKTLNNGPRFVVTRTTSSIGIKGNYDERHILEVSTNIVQLPEFFIPSSIARTSKLSTVATSGSYNDLTDKPETSGVDIFVWDYSIEGSEGTVTEDKLQRIKECDILRIVISGIEIDATRGYQPDLVVTASLVMTGIISVMIQFSGLNYVATTDIRNVPTEEDISGMGFTKNTGTISKIKINGSTIIRQTDGIMDIGNYQVPLVSGTNIATFGGKSLLGNTDLLSPQIITSDIAGNVDVSVGNCYIFSKPQSTVKTFNLIWPGSIYNNSLTIIINLNNNVSISFASNNSYPILWANGTTPTLESGKQIYEINFRPSPAGWLGVVVPFTVN